MIKHVAFKAEVPMRKWACCLGVLLCCVVSCRPSDFGVKSGASSWQGEALPNSFLVSFCPGDGRKFPVTNSFQEEGLYFEDLLRTLRSDSRIKMLSFITAMQNPAEETLHSRLESCSLAAVTRVDFFEAATASRMLNEWQKEGRIAFWEPNWLSRLSKMPQANLAKPYLGDGSRWWTDAIQLGAAIDAIKTTALVDGENAASPVLAVLDSGMDVHHPALADRIWHNPDSAHSPCRHDLWGCNTVDPPDGFLGEGTAHPYGTQGPGELCEDQEQGMQGDCIHGTHIAGILAGDVEMGVPGVCPFCKIMNIRVIEKVGGEGRVPDSAILRALKYLSLFERRPGKNLVRVVNLSFGKYQKGKAVALFIEYLAKHRDGILVFAAAGNEDSQKRVYPAAHEPVIAVTGLAASGRKASYSNYGPWVNIAAPGGEFREGRDFAIESSVPGGALALSQGTSMATPVVAGVAGLLLTVNPELSLAELRQTILDAANPAIYDASFAEAYNFRNYYPELENGKVPLLGVGMVDASAAVRSIKRQESTLKKKERIQIDCAQIVTNGGSHESHPLSLLLFFAPLLFVLGWRWRERLGPYVRDS